MGTPGARRQYKQCFSQDELGCGAAANGPRASVVQTIKVYILFMLREGELAVLCHSFPLRDRMLPETLLVDVAEGEGTVEGCRLVISHCGISSVHSVARTGYVAGPLLQASSFRL